MIPEKTVWYLRLPAKEAVVYGGYMKINKMGITIVLLLPEDLIWNDPVHVLIMTATEGIIDLRRMEVSMISSPQLEESSVVHLYLEGAEVGQIQCLLVFKSATVVLSLKYLMP